MLHRARALVSKRHIHAAIGTSVAPPILPPCPPTLLPPGAVKDRLSEFLVDIVVGITQPSAKLAATAGFDRIFADVGLEVLSADPARV